MDLGLQDRIAFIAGASAGLGYAVAERLVAEGCRVAICSRNEQHIKAAAERLSADPDRVLPVVCNVTDEPQIKAAIEQTVAHFGGLNILVTNAGGPSAGPTGAFSADDWRRAIELNLISTINLCRHAVQPIREAARQDNGLGRILMISSISAKQPVPNLSLSNTTRAGVQGFAKSLSEELGAEGITVNTILPGYTRTERLIDLATATQQRTGASIEAIEAGWASSAALKRLADPSEFADAAAFLVSARASYITGVSLLVDGGYAKGLL
jgi:3-oxoacyl-[acyl-carrier protein] reductase